MSYVCCRRSKATTPVIPAPRTGTNTSAVRPRSGTALTNQRFSACSPTQEADVKSSWSVGDTSTVHRYGRGATSVLRVSAVRAPRLRIRDRMN
eukprot:6204765-Pleurochrysis_carterae.AAC.1